MKMPLAILTTLALAGYVSAAPAGAVSTSGPQTKNVTFDTALVPQYYGAGEYDGVMHLTIAPDGTVNGWYRDADVGTIRTLIGGLNGDKLWLDLGGGNLVDIQGTYDDGKIVASTFLGDQLYTFKATPMKD